MVNELNRLLSRNDELVLIIFYFKRDWSKTCICDISDFGVILNSFLNIFNNKAITGIVRKDGIF